MTERLIKWVIFSVLIALVPLLFAVVRLWYLGSSFNYADVLGRGELLLVCAGMCAAAIGEVFTSQPQRPVFRLVVGGGCVLVLFFSCLVFADTSASVVSAQDVDNSKVASLSLVVWFCGLVSSAGCIAVS